jgi:hypothetical protein
VADTLTTQSATPATVPASSVIGTDEVTIGAVAQHVQRVKLVDGTDGGTDLLAGTAANGLKVDVTRFADRTGTGSLTALNQAVTMTDLQGADTLAFQLTGTWVGTVLVEGSVDGGTTWVAVVGFQNFNTGALVASVTANGIYIADIAGLQQARVRCSAFTSGTITVNARVGSGTSLVAIDAPLPTGTNSIGNIGTVTTVTGVTTVTTLTNITNWGNVADNAAWTDGTTRLSMSGYVLDETLGTALTENDAAAARINANRAQVFTLEDNATRGQRQSVNASGGASVTPVPHTAGGESISHLIAAATTNATVVKGSAGQVYGWNCTNEDTVWHYVKLHNQATTPTAGTGVVYTIGIPPGGGTNETILNGIPFATGIGMTVVKGVADADATAATASKVNVNIRFK